LIVKGPSATCDPPGMGVAVTVKEFAFRVPVKLHV
jgi:hypothetical protein